MTAKERQPEEEFSFEEAMERLEKLVAELEGGDLPLEPIEPLGRLAHAGDEVAGDHAGGDPHG